MPHRDVIAVGGSLGAIEASKRLCAGLPADLPATVLIALHLSPDSPGVLAQMLAAVCALPVTKAIDGEPMQRGRVYVAPPDRHLLVVDDIIRLGRGPRENLSRPAVDALFRSVAVCCGYRAIGVVLTGMLDDGAAGLATIKACGGLAVVQSPADALADSMPMHALHAAEVDYRGAIDELAAVLVKLVGEPAGTAQPATEMLLREVEIALGGAVSTAVLSEIATPVALSCPACGGVLSQVNQDHVVRFRCQVGHAFSAEALYAKQEDAVDEAMRVALRIIEERAVLTEKLAQQARDHGRHASAASFEQRAREYREQEATLRRVLIG